MKINDCSECGIQPERSSLWVGLYHLYCPICNKDAKPAEFAMQAVDNWNASNPVEEHANDIT